MNIKQCAVRSGGVIWTLPRPARHDEVLRVVRESMSSESYAMKRCSTDENERLIQGFITDGGEFVDRLAAGRIAKAAGQVRRLCWAPNLYSEDLW